MLLLLVHLCLLHCQVKQHYTGPAKMATMLLWLYSWQQGLP
jgi:hypothetical protein